MAKQEAEHSNTLNIFWLKKRGYLDGGERSGSIRWTYGNGRRKGSIGITVITSRDNGNSIRLRYAQTSRETNVKESMDYRVELATTRCNYGSVRYWFICPLTRNEQYCGKRVGVLYGAGKYFGCRSCGDIAYASQMRGGKYRGSSVCLPDIERAEKEVKRYYYNGKPTRKYKRVIRMNERANRDLLTIAARLDKRFSRFTDLKK